MPSRPFVHLHCHSHYSLEAGASKIPARVRQAQARAQAAEQALQAAQTGLAQRAAALDRAQDDADARERAAPTRPSR